MWDSLVCTWLNLEYTFLYSRCMTSGTGWSSSEIHLYVVGCSIIRTSCAWSTESILMLSNRLFAIGIRRAKIVNGLGNHWSSRHASDSSCRTSHISIKCTMLNLFGPLLDIPTTYYGALLGVGFCAYYLFEVVKVSNLINTPSVSFSYYFSGN